MKKRKELNKSTSLISKTNKLNFNCFQITKLINNNKILNINLNKNYICLHCTNLSICKLYINKLKTNYLNHNQSTSTSINKYKTYKTTNIINKTIKLNNITSISIKSKRNYKYKKHQLKYSTNKNKITFNI